MKADLGRDCSQCFQEVVVSDITANTLIDALMQQSSLGNKDNNACCNSKD